jgi:GT2 family glycosyltransferase
MVPTRTTVVIATHNRRDDLVRTLVKLEKHAPDVPIIVVDNGSRDGTAGLVRAGFPSVSVLELEQNLGASARNLGVRLARTPYVAFSDDDSWWAEGALARAEAVFERHPRLGLIAARTLVGPAQEPDPMNCQLANSPLTRAPDLPGPVVLGFLCCAAVVRREAYLDAGGIDPVLFFIGEEKLLAWDLAAKGWACCYVEEVIAAHHPSSRRGNGHDRRVLELRNDLLSIWLRRPARLGWRAFGALAWRGTRDADARRAVRSALRLLPAALRERRRLPDAVQHQVDLLEHTDG